MARRIPIEVEKIKTIYQNLGTNDDSVNGRVEYLISVTEKGQIWEKTIRCGLKELTRLRDEISEIIESTTTAERLNITNNKANILDKHYAQDQLCQNCNYRLTSHCLTCEQIDL